MSISKEAIEAGARAIWARHWPGLDYDAESTIVEQSRCQRDATAALTAAAPFIAAQAKAEALREAADAADDPSPDEMDFYQIDQAQVGNWLRARADQLEGKSE